MTTTTLLQTQTTSSHIHLMNHDLPTANPKRALLQSHSTDTTPQQPIHKGVKRTRKAHNKVRTGCLTCKIRRKKCDETRPACTRCTSTGRKCDGYTAVIAPTSTTDVPELRADLAGSVAICSFDHQDLPEYIPGGPRVIELHVDSAGASEPAIIDERTDETEVSDFILSYPSSSRIDDSTPSSPSSLSECKLLSGPQRAHSHSPFPTTYHHNHPSILPRSPNFFPPSSSISPIEISCFSYFKHITGPSFASYFDSSIWRTYAINAALAHPVVFAAATALGAVHQRFNHGISREAFEYCAHADRLHAKAVKSLEDLKTQNVNRGLLGTNESGGRGMGVCDRDVIMTSEMLLGLFQGFQQNYDEAVKHMNNGMKYLLARPKTLVHSETRYCAVESKSNVFSQLFHQLHCRSLQLFGSPTNILVKCSDGASLPTMPHAFASLEEARDFLFTEVDWIINTPVRAWVNLDERSHAQSLHVERLMKWSVGYAETIKGMERTTEQKRACMLMKLVRNATHLLLFMTLFGTVNFELPPMPNVDRAIDDDPVQDPGLSSATKALFEMVSNREYLTTNLARVKILAEGILDNKSIFSYDEHSISFDSAIGPPRSAVKLPSSSNKSRHLVKTFLKQNADASDVWEMLGVYGVAERISAVEEHAVILAIRDVIPEHLDPKWVDITCIMESRKILLRYCHPGSHGMGMMWTQEWWAF